MWLSELTGDEDEAYLADGLTNGFFLAPADTVYVKVDMDNYKLATNPVTKPLVEQTILAEIQEGNYVVTPTTPIVVSALGAIPKKDSSEIRLIHDCSRPHGQALNDYISIDSFKYQSLDAALALLQPNLTTLWPKLTCAALIGLSPFTPATTKQLVANGNSRGQIVLLISMMPAFHLGQKLPQLFSTVLLKQCVV